ncbi:hypothetical protein GCM10008023_25540 [Sphingomonas glacialis]|uniref:DUF4412 domain-containing protein n=1 Tax=Sphingomonas glacialis TaxID=658225 RepID=A0ABQ3LKF3_9SPHN|nr:hypothetical protein [Sphingomonas glacialis]GHH18990.1 hypothetical protein GCM10008023_25540 [Sphingomonas glacialis]
MLRQLFCVMTLSLSVPAWADTTAVYRASGAPFEMQVEVAANGNVRGKVMGQAAYFLTLSGEGYLVLETPTGPAVDRLGDVAAIMAETLDAMFTAHPELKNAMAQQPSILVQEHGTAVVGGRTGKAYFFVGQDQKRSPRAVAVVSDDPALAELGKAMAAQFDMSIKLNPMMGKSAFATQMSRILHGGTALTFGGGDLVSVRGATIDPARFVLPAKPETLDQARDRFKANGGHLP